MLEWSYCSFALSHRNNQVKWIRTYMHITNETGNYLKYWVNHLWGISHWINGRLRRYVIPFYIASMLMRLLLFDAHMTAYRLHFHLTYYVLWLEIKEMKGSEKRQRTKEWICATDSFCDEITLQSFKSNIGVSGFRYKIWFMFGA